MADSIRFLKVTLVVLKKPVLQNGRTAFPMLRQWYRIKLVLPGLVEIYSPDFPGDSGQAG